MINKQLVSVLLLLSASVAAASGLLLPPFTYVGRIVDVDHAGTVGATMRAWNARGELVARTTTYANGTTPRNYRLVIPVATTETRGYATVGETLAFEIAVVKDETTVAYRPLVPQDKRAVGDPGDIVTLDLMAADADATTAEGVSKAYLSGIASQMRRSGHKEWNGAEDWDGDGMSNLAEYFAGTSPFDAGSKLSVTLTETTVKSDGSTCLSLSFKPVKGRVYSVGTVGDLASGSWKRTPFATTSEGDATTTYYNATDDTPVTFYLPKDTKKSAAFYRLQVD